jgi:hypothetical protein
MFGDVLPRLGTKPESRDQDHSHVRTLV